MTEATAVVSPLRRRMIDDMSLRNLSPATQRSYLHVVTKFSRYFGRSPDWPGLEDVRAFQVYLLSQGISWPALNQAADLSRYTHRVAIANSRLVGGADETSVTLPLARLPPRQRAQAHVARPA